MNNKKYSEYGSYDYMKYDDSIILPLIIFIQQIHFFFFITDYGLLYN